MRFLQRLKRLTLKERRGVVIDFASTRQMHAEGTLLFCAELSRILELKEREVRVRCRAARSSKVGQVLRQVGIYRMLCCHGHGAKPRDDDVVNWRTTRGSDVEGSKFNDIISRTLGDSLPSGADQYLYRAISESMTNAVHHAYVGQRKSVDGLPSNHGWWTFSQVRDEALTVVFCDLGIGIPVSLRHRHPAIFQRVKQVFGIAVESALVQEATQLNVSSTDEPHRGKGLTDMVEHLDRHLHASLTILSNRGVFSRRNRRTRTYDAPDSIFGTLLCWRIPFGRTHD